MIFNKNFLIGQELVKRNLINQGQLDKGLILHEEKGIRLGRALIELGYIDENDLINVIADQLSIKHINLSDISVTQEILDCISVDIAEKYDAFPIAHEHDVLTICVADPLNTELIHELQKKYWEKY